MARKAGAARDEIPAGRRERTPLITLAGWRRLCAIVGHADAPPWNYEVGDRVVRADLRHVEALRLAVREAREHGTPPPPIVDWVRRMRPLVRHFRQALPEGADPSRDWPFIPTTSRGDLARRPEDFLPADADLSRLVVYQSSGTTGEPLTVHHHPRAMALNHALMEFVLERHGLRPRWSASMTACVNVSAQAETAVFGGVFSLWRQAGFAKVNLSPREWDPDRARRFFRDLAPLFLTGDPVAYAEMLRWGIDVRPSLVLSTAAALSPGLKARLEEHFGCPVVDTYSTTETGPIAYAPPGGEGLSVLPPDLYVEVVDGEGRPAPEGRRGEICVTGGRNPYLPLLRYRTGDFGSLTPGDAPSLSTSPRILDLEARAPVLLRAADGSAVGPVDVSRVIRRQPFVRHSLLQRRDGSIALAMEPVPGRPIDGDSLKADLGKLFGDEVTIDLRLDGGLEPQGPGGKVVPFRSELDL